MSGKKGSAVRLETEIEKSREDSRWNRVIELAEQLKQGSPNQEALADFLLGEGKLESFLENYPPIEINISKARQGLSEACNYLLNSTSELGKKERVALDGNLLLGKLSFACGRYEDAIKYYNTAELDTLSEKELPCRGLKIVAESYAINGLCLEKLPPGTSSKFKQAEREERIRKCFELSSDLTLLYLQELDRMQQQQQQMIYGGTLSSHTPTLSIQRQMGPILETALQRAPILHIQSGNLSHAVKRYRSMLSAVESSASQSLRLTLSRQLAEVLLRGPKGVLYTPPSAPTKGGRSSGTESPWKPRQYSSINMFVPRVDHEEVVLLLLVAEEMAVRDTVLSQAPEFQAARRVALDTATTIYDLLAVAVVRWGQASLLNEVLERAMKFSFHEKHVWTQRALCLLSMGRHFHSLAVLKEVKALAPDKTYPCLLGARICYEFLERPKEGTEWSREAVDREAKHPQRLMSRCLLYLGIGYHLQAQATTLKDEKEELQNQAMEAFIKAQSIDSNDHLIEYYLALHQASVGNVPEAVAHARSALSLFSEHAASMQLLALLMTAQKQFDEASSLLDFANAEYPDHLHIMFLKANLALAMDDAPTALQTAQHMLAVWKQEYEGQIMADNSDMSDRRSEARSVFQLYTSELSDKDTGSLHAQSIAASRVEHALSEVASSISSFTPRPGPQRAWLLQAQVWLLLAEIYLRIDEPSSAEACVHEAALIFPLSHQVLFMRGLIHEHRQEFVEAKQWFQNAVAVSPGHVKSLQHLGLMYHHLGCQRLADKILRDAAKLDPRAPTTWYHLGIVLESIGEYGTAADCMSTALEVETACPILPYETLPLSFE